MDKILTYCSAEAGQVWGEGAERVRNGEYIRVTNENQRDKNTYRLFRRSRACWGGGGREGNVW